MKTYSKVKDPYTQHEFLALNTYFSSFSKKQMLKYTLTRTKTSIRYAKENEREREKGRRRIIEREGEIREREREI